MKKQVITENQATRLQVRHMLERDTAGRPDLNQASPWLRDIEDAQSNVFDSVIMNVYR